MGVRIDTGVELQDIFGEAYKFEVQDDKGKAVLVAESVPDILKLFLRNLNSFYARANNGKAMPWEWAEHSVAIGTEMRRDNGVMELDRDDHAWLMERVKEFGTTFMQANAAQLKTWLSAMPDLALVKEGTE